MAKLCVPDLAVMRDWLGQLGISFFECDACQAAFAALAKYQRDF